MAQHDPTAMATANSFNKILNQSKVATKSRASGEIDDGTKKLRRLILVEGIPSEVVCTPTQDGVEPDISLF
jgi:hypothetical protein